MHPEELCPDAEGLGHFVGGNVWEVLPLLQVGRIHSPVLAEALFDIYLGTNPVSPDAKESISRGIAQLAQLA